MLECKNMYLQIKQFPQIADHKELLNFPVKVTHLFTK
jgi:hypothetical protein